MSILAELLVGVKPFVQQAYPIQPAVTAPIPGFEPASAPAPSVPAWQGRSIGTTKLRLVEFSAFLEQQRDPDSYNKHLFVHIGHANHSYSDPLLESVDIRQIYDKFPEKKGGLKELFGKGPQNAFFLVKFWDCFWNSVLRTSALSYLGSFGLDQLRSLQWKKFRVHLRTYTYTQAVGPRLFAS
ncbi:hypothetical protein CB1_002237003 [Camelus ferus]|nr:hypothetical protein CB1_002237003 [Camelus ferus]